MRRQQERMAKRKADDAARGKKPANTGPLSPEMMETQMKTMNGMMLWFLPATLLFTGFLWHIGLLTYMVSNNVWTLVQTKLVFDKMDKEEAAEEEAKREARRASAPQVGARKVDNRSKKQRAKDAQNQARTNANTNHPEGVTEPEEQPEPQSEQKTRQQIQNELSKNNTSKKKKKKGK